MRQHAYVYPRKPGRVRNIVLAALVAAVVTAAIAVALYIAVLAWGDAGALTVQNRHLQRQVTSLSGQVSSLKSGEATLAHLLAPILPYAATVCSQDLTGPSGPAQYYFVCTDQKPSPQPTS